MKGRIVDFHHVHCTYANNGHQRENILSAHNDEYSKLILGIYTRYLYLRDKLNASKQVLSEM